MEVLLVHKNFPGQFVHLIKALKARNDKITFISASVSKKKTEFEVTHYIYTPEKGNGCDTHKLAIETETKVIRGEIVAKIAEELRRNGYIPNIIIAHPGWGEALFLKDVWPEVPQLHYVEYCYGAAGTDADFDDRYAIPKTLTERSRSRMKNANTYLNLDSMSWGLTPTKFQLSTIPRWAQNKVSVIHDGIDTKWASPNSKATLKVSQNLSLDGRNEIITFINRTFEPYRGVHIFLECLPDVLNSRPNARVLLVGNDSPFVSYGANRTDGTGWLTALKSQIGNIIDWERVHCLGNVSHDTLRSIYQISSAHVYLTYPFVLSWSMLEAMSCGALVIGSDTKPVQEIIQHGFNGLLVPFQDSSKLSSELISALSKPEKYRTIRENARNTIVNDFDLLDCTRKLLSLIDAIASGAVG